MAAQPVPHKSSATTETPILTSLNIPAAYYHALWAARYSPPSSGPARCLAVFGGAQYLAAVSTEPRQPTPRRGADANPPDLSATEVITGSDPPAERNSAPLGSKRRLALSALALVALAVAGVKLGGALSGSEREATALSSASAEHAPPPPMPSATSAASPTVSARLTPVAVSAANAAIPASARAAVPASALPKPKRPHSALSTQDLSAEFGGRR